MTIFHGTKPLDDFRPRPGPGKSRTPAPEDRTRKAIGGRRADIRPLKAAETWLPEYASRIEAMAGMGFDAREIAGALGVPWPTFSRWVRERYTVQHALATGFVRADANVAHSLYLKACGYTHAAEEIYLTTEKEYDEEGKLVGSKQVPLRVETVKHYAPDTEAAKFWLKNRRGHQWQDRHEVNHTGEIRLTDMTDEQLATIAAGPIIDADPAAGGGRALEAPAGAEEPAPVHPVHEADVPR